MGVMQAHPGLMAASIPWLSGVDYKRLCAWFPYVSIVLVLTRDRGCGRVAIGRDGLPRLHYWPDAHDRASMMKVAPHPARVNMWIRKHNVMVILLFSKRKILFAEQ